eukprot:tig00020562_g11139.t1
MLRCIEEYTRGWHATAVAGLADLCPEAVEGEREAEGGAARPRAPGASPPSSSSSSSSRVVNVCVTRSGLAEAYAKLAAFKLQPFFDGSPPPPPPRPLAPPLTALPLTAPPLTAPRRAAKRDIFQEVMRRFGDDDGLAPSARGPGRSMTFFGFLPGFLAFFLAFWLSSWLGDDGGLAPPARGTGRSVTYAAVGDDEEERSAAEKLGIEFHDVQSLADLERAFEALKRRKPGGAAGP